LEREHLYPAITSEGSVSASGGGSVSVSANGSHAQPLRDPSQTHAGLGS
jgi:hypothetical protein